MRLKKGVSLIGIQPQITIAMQIVEPIINAFEQELVITAGTEGDPHDRNSKHRIGQAIDIRIRDIINKFSDDQADERAMDIYNSRRRLVGVLIGLTDDISNALGGEYYAQLELKRKHIHIQYNGI